MKLLISLIIVAAVVGIWVVWGRNWLHEKPWAWSRAFFDLIEPIEIKLWSKSETVLWARAKQVIGILLTALTMLGTIDLTPIMPFVPDQYEGLVRLAFNLLPMIITMVGTIDVKLRQDTTKPLAIVALPATVAAAMPEVQAAEAAKVDAVMAVKEQAKAA